MPESRIFSVPIEEEMQSSYLDYAMSVIVGRALPDVRDGLKPVHRRILYAMHEIGLHHNRPYKKSATVVGEVLGKYHPHGDAAVYDTLVRMAQDFSMRYPLIDGQGNFGSIDGDAAAAYRYTEARLSKIAEELLRDIDKDTVDFVPNFDEKLKEPVVLPAGFPNLLANGSSGIAVGMATNIPPHNLNELIDALIYIIDNPDAELDDIMKFIKGPDFPTGAIIMGVENIRKAYETGNGSIIVESAYHIEEGKRGKNSIVITEIPYQVNKASLIMEIAALVKTGKVVGISDIRDESNRDGIRIVLELKQGAQIRVILNKLLLKTKLRTSYGINLLALVDGVPRRLSLLEMLKLYLEHRRVVVERRSRFLLERAERRAHIIEGLRKALDHIDEIINILRSSKDVPTAKAKLIKRFEFSE
ncbi:DNA gyrase subunit A, partial [bacterium]